MSDAPPSSIKIGSRSSGLALWQARLVAGHLRDLLPHAGIDIVEMSSPGDRDLVQDLRESAPDFFTRDLDDAVRSGALDCAAHSAKDLPEPMPDGIDWCWLPWRADPRDALVFATGKTAADLPPNPRIGISSDRRDAYCRERFPEAEFAPLRGTIEQRLAQLDTGDFDVLIIAAAALIRLELDDRIGEWIPLEQLPVPEGQGVLALTFREGNARMQALRAMFIKSVRFVGAGVGRADFCTVAGLDEIRAADVCLYDSLLDPALADAVPRHAEAVFVGKRCGQASMTQGQIIRMMLDQVRRGKRVVRLKGGDPGIFGRLAEEAEALDAFGIPFRVVPGVSSLNVATTGTGMLSTRRGLSRGFCAMTPMMTGGKKGPVDAATRAELPLAFFMVMHSVEAVRDTLLADGWRAATPAAVVFSAGSAFERIVEGTLDSIADKVSDYRAASGASGRGPKPGDPALTDPGLLLVGDTAAYRYPVHGPLGGKRVLLTCSESLQAASAQAVFDAGGVPIAAPLVSLQVAPSAPDVVADITDYDWIAVTSPSAVRCLFDALHEAGADLRMVPQVMCCGAGTSAALQSFGIHANLEPVDHFGAEGLITTVAESLTPGARILRLRSDLAGESLADAMRDLGHDVTDEVLYINQSRTYERLPPFDAVFFASGSSVKAFEAQWGIACLKDVVVVVIGDPTARVLRSFGREPDVMPAEAMATASISALAECYIRKSI